jgi:hypothetical protein
MLRSMFAWLIGWRFPLISCILLCHPTVCSYEHYAVYLPLLSAYRYIITHFIHSFAGAYSPGWTFGLPFRCFLISHIQTHGRTPLDEWSARRRDLYLHKTTQHMNTRDRHSSHELDSNPRPQWPRGHWDRLTTHLQLRYFSIPEVAFNFMF